MQYTQGAMRRNSNDFEHVPSQALTRRVHINPYGLAVLSALLGAVLRLLVDPWLGNQSPYITFLASVALTGLYAGVRPALLCTALSAIVGYFCFVPPRYHVGFAGTSDAVDFVTFLAAALGMVLLTRARNKAHEETERNLCERLQAERKLRDTQKLLEMFEERRPGCAYVREESGRYVYYNDEARLLFGAGDGISGGKTEARMKLEDQDRRVLASSHGTMQFVDKLTIRGEERYWLTTKFIFTNEEQHKLVGSLSVDITSQMQAEQVVLERARLAAASQMVSMVAHEINNPLAALTNLLFLLGREALPSPAQEFVTITQHELTRLTHITRLVIGLYTQTEIPVTVDACRLVDDVIMRMATQFLERGGRVQRDFRWHGKFVACASQISQIIENVIANSLECGAGEIRIRVARSRDWRIASRSGLRISILDNGAGMSPEQRKRAFEPFFSTKMEKGTGLGLWVAKAIALRNGGNIALRSTDNPRRHSTCISIFLPDSVVAGPGVSPELVEQVA